MKPLKVIISGGGTGGHIFPAIAIANAITLILPDADILFIGAQGKMEMEKVPAAGYKIKGLWVSGLQRRLTIKNLLFPFKVVLSLIKAGGIIRKFKPDVVIGVGGYASGPTLRMATLLKIPTLIQEQNSFPGMTNRLLAHKVSKICVAYPGMEKFFPAEKILLTGNPVRQDIISVDSKRKEAIDFYKLNPNKKTVLVVGGSLGALTINRNIQNLIPFFQLHDIQLIWQTGKNYFSIVEQEFTPQALENITVVPFITRMDLAYAAADIIVSRAGAIAISELCVVMKPVVLIPSPNVTDDHQTKNALALTEKNAAILIADADVSQKLQTVLLNLIENKELQHELMQNMKSFAITDAANIIAKSAIELTKHNKNGTF